MKRLFILFSFVGVMQLMAQQKQFDSSWQSLEQYNCPEWFTDAKFGIWAHWGPQAVPGDGDWYARGIYEPGNGHYKYHLENYGHPSEFGYKDIIPLWKAEKWDPNRLMLLYKKAGAKYFVSMGVHHDNFDLWNSKYQKWNAVKMGPKRDIVGEWQKAAKKYGLRFGVSEHLGASYTWLQTSHGSDKNGPKAGVPYDGADPRYADLYHSKADPDDDGWYTKNPMWHADWSKRIHDLIENYKPDLLYSDGGLPFGVTGRQLLADFYNDNMKNHRGKLEAVYNCKAHGGNTENCQFVAESCVPDVERGGMSAIQRIPWQTDTSIGDWFYNRSWKPRGAEWIIRMLADIVSKNGNLLLNIQLDPDGSLSPDIEKTLESTGKWMETNGQAIYATRPWQVYGEGPTRLVGGSFDDSFDLTNKDIRFTQSKDGKTLYAMVLGWPDDKKIVIHSLAKPNEVQSVKLLGCKEKLAWNQKDEGLEITLPAQKISDIAIVFAIEGKQLQAVPVVQIIRPSSNGEINLNPTQADVHGNIKFEKRDQQYNAGTWNNAEDYLSWTVDFPAPGKYMLKGSYSAAKGGSGLLVESSSISKLNIALKQTKSWDDFRSIKSGIIEVKTAGKSTVIIRPADAAEWAPVNLRTIVLEPVNEANNPVDDETSWEHAPSAYVVPPGMVRGGAFIDRILPMPVGPNGLRSDVWGGNNVKPRNVENGIEDPKWSFWCMSVHKDSVDGKEHLFGVRWPESSPAGHMYWPNSHVYHAVSDSPTGPFKVVNEDIGPGHNVMCYRAKDGTYVLYVNGGAYVSASVNGPWKRYDLKYDTRGTSSGEMTNHTFARREDGSVLMISRGGRVWISEDGLKPFRKITLESAYPKIKGEFEDPVVWRDEVQYNLIVNDWYGRTAYYLRSKDGVNWVWDQGMAYDVNIVRHPDGSRENWYKFERPNVRQDESGRATHIYFAVIDSRKDLDKGSDNHSSKVIALPLVVQKRLEILNKEPITSKTKELNLLIKAEPGFNPLEDIDLASLRFGAPRVVDFGKGSKLIKSTPMGKNLLVTFSADELCFASDDYVGKLLGSAKNKELVFGYARLPGQSFQPALVSTPPPAFTANGVKLLLENFGLKASQQGKVIVTAKGTDGVTRTSQVKVPSIAPYGKANVMVPLKYEALRGMEAAKIDIKVACDQSEFSMGASFTELSAKAKSSVRLGIRNANIDLCGWGQSKESFDKKNELKVGNTAFAYGIRTHAPSRQEWMLDGTFNKLTFKTGVASGQSGSITVEVWADGKRIYNSPILKSGDDAITVTLPVKGVKQLCLIGTDGGNGNGSDHVVYGEPALTKD